MTIFQKMLVVPLISLAIYVGFIMYANSRYSESNKSVEEIRDDYIPLLDIAAENNRLFKEISQVFKDAVLAGEISWIENNEKLKTQISYNFFQLQKYPDIVASHELNNAIKYFNQYFNSASDFATAMIKKPDEFMKNHELNPDIELYFNQTRDSFENLRESIYGHFRDKINATNNDMKQLLFRTGNISVLLILISTIVTVIASFSTRKNLIRLISRMKSLAQGSTDFSRRLKPTSKDELGTLIYWFNKLSLKLEKEHKQLEIISNTDKLTQLNNRMSADNHMSLVFSESFRNNKPLSVAIVDIDLFKSINDNYGHHSGDSVLVNFAKILRDNLRPDDFVARWGGEEFIIILSDTTLQQAKDLLQRLRLKIEQHSFDIPKQVTASFGLSQAKNDEDIHELFKRVDSNLYKAKESGRNQVVSDD